MKEGNQTAKEKLVQMITELNDYEARMFLAFIERVVGARK